MGSALATWSASRRSATGLGAQEKGDRAVRFAASVVGICWCAGEAVSPPWHGAGTACLRVREQVKEQRKVASSSWASGVRWEEGESCQWGQGVSGSARGELAVRPHKQSGPCARSRAGACGAGRRSGFGGCPFEGTGWAGPRFGSRGGRPGRLAASGRAGQKQAGLGGYG